MNVVRVSTLEAFRRWRNDEGSSVDDLFNVPETEVAPHAGAWIETAGKLIESLITASRTPRGCVD